MNFLPRISIIILLGFVLFSCTKDDETYCPPPVPTDSTEVMMLFEATTNGVPLELLKNFDDPLGREMQVEMLKFYVSNIYVHNGTNAIKVHDVGLIILADPNVPDSMNKYKEIVLRIPSGSYDKISFGIGLDPIQNTSNPTDYPSDHPLSISQNTYWDSWTNYKFFMIEGKGDWDGDGFLTNIYSYHTGFDICYRELVFDKNLNLSPYNDIMNLIRINFEVNDVFFGQDTVNMKTHPTWHGDTNTIETALILSDNLQNAIKLE